MTEKKDVELVRKRLEYGVDPDISSRAGTIMGIAERIGDPKILAELGRALMVRSNPDASASAATIPRRGNSLRRR